jgi:signal transduction histidine kinase
MAFFTMSTSSALYRQEQPSAIYPASPLAIILSPKDILMSDFEADIAAVTRVKAVPRILDVICKTTGMGFAAVARVTEDRWICCASQDEIGFGLKPGGELQVATTICHEIRQSHQGVVIDHVSEDAAFCGHHTPAQYGFQSYISMPIMLADGAMFGTLCAIDPRPAKLKNPQTIEMFKLFAELIADHLELSDRFSASQTSLRNERSNAVLRERFVAVLGHDLRNPLAAIAAGARLFPKAKSEQKAAEISRMMLGSVERMSRLIDDVLDLARTRLGGGIALTLKSEFLEPVLKQVIQELQLDHPDRAIVTEFSLSKPVQCDSARISQLVSNLLGNALTHGAKDRPIRIVASSEDGLDLRIINEGPPIPDEVRSRLFQPFYRGEVRPSMQGLGLGLYIAQAIARAHHGTLDVTSDSETSFNLRIPPESAAIRI